MDDYPTYMQTKKVDWLVAQGGEIIHKDEKIIKVKTESGIASIDTWGRVIWEK